MGEVDHSVGVAPLVVVPGHNLDEAGGEGDASISVEDGGAWVSGEVLGDDSVLSVAEDALELVLGGLLDALLDLVVAGIAAESHGQVDDGDVSGGHTEGHAGQLAVELGDDLADGLGGAGRGGDDVGAGGTSGTPVLATLGWAINGELVDGDGVDGRHEALLDAPTVVEDLGDGSEAVGRARGVRDDGHVAVVALVVDAHHEDGGAVLGRSGDDGLLGTTLDVGAGGLGVAEDTGALSDVVGTDLAPRDGAWVSLLEDVDLLAVDLDTAIGLLDGSLELTCSTNVTSSSQIKIEAEKESYSMTYRGRSRT